MKKVKDHIQKYPLENSAKESEQVSGPKKTLMDEQEGENPGEFTRLNGFLEEILNPPNLADSSIDSELIEKLEEDRNSLVKKLVGDYPNVQVISPGLVVGDQYEIGEFIAEGSTGKVYKGFHQNLKIPIAVKFIPIDLRRELVLRERFLKETQSLVSIKHPHVVRIFDVGKMGKYLYLVLDYIPGLTLKQFIKKHFPIDIEQAVQMMINICEALYVIHEKDIIHRDIKPGNIVIQKNGNPVLMDFGLAKFEIDGEWSNGLTKEGSFLGTPEYMAPEQFRSPQRVNKASDIYSLGCVFYELLTAEKPVVGNTLLDYHESHLTYSPDPVHKRSSRVPPAISPIIEKMIAKKAERRYQNCREIIDDLRKIVLTDKNTPNQIEPVPNQKTDPLKSQYLGKNSGNKRLKNTLNEDLTEEEKRLIIPKIWRRLKHGFPIAIPLLIIILTASYLTSRYMLDAQPGKKEDITYGTKIANLGEMVLTEEENRPEHLQENDGNQFDQPSSSMNSSPIHGKKDDWSSSPWIISVIPFGNPGHENRTYFSSSISMNLKKMGFTLVERDEIEAVVAELDRTKANLTSLEYSLRIGKMTGAFIIITGDISTYQGEEHVIARAFSVETSEIMSMVKLNPKNIAQNIQELVEQAREYLEFRSYIKSIQPGDGRVVLQHGQDYGAQIGMRLSALTDQGKASGVLEIIDFENELGVAKVVMNEGELTAGLRVQEVKED